MEQRTFFDVMGTAPATVTVVTTLDAAGRPRGVTVAAVTSVSADPPSLLVSLDHRSRTLAELTAHGWFGVNFLRGDRVAIARRFSSVVAQRFDGVEWRPGATGVPILHVDSLSWAECRVTDAVPSGDHVVIIASVEDGAAPPPTSRPLMYFRHHYEAWPGALDDGSRVDVASQAAPEGISIRR